jgi:hypothetical protein
VINFIRILFLLLFLITSSIVIYSIYPRNVKLYYTNLTPSSFNLELKPPKLIFEFILFFNIESQNFIEILLKKLTLSIFHNSTLRNEYNYLGEISRYESLKILPRDNTSLSIELKLENNFSTNFVVLSMIEELSKKGKLNFVFNGFVIVGYFVLPNLNLSICFEKVIVNKKFI